jgi:hypothetical protein
MAGTLFPYAQRPHPLSAWLAVANLLWAVTLRNYAF